MSDKPSGNWRRCFTRFLVTAFAMFVVVLAIMWFDEPADIGTGWAFAAICGIGVTVPVWLGYIFIRWLCSWRNFRKFLIGVGCFAALVAAFYIEENWRGKRAWENFKHEWEAKGEKFSLTELAPPPVPDEQNFALTPIVASCYSDQIDRHGHKLNTSNTNIVNRLELGMYRENDWENWPTNTGGNWQKAIPTDLKVWQQYYRTPPTNCVTNEFPITVQPQSPAADVLLALSKYASTIEELRQASRLPYSRFPLAYDSENPSVILLPHLARLKGCVQTLRLRASAELQAGQTDKAMADVKLALYLTDSIRNEPFLIDHLVRIAIFQISLTPIWEGLAEHRWTDSQLAELENELQKEDFLADYRYSMRGERTYNIASIDYFRRHQTYPEQLSCWWGDDESIYPWCGTSPLNVPESIFRIGVYLMPKGWYYQNEIVAAKFHQQYLLPSIDPAKHLAFPKITSTAKESFVAIPYRPWNFLAKLVFPALGPAGKKYAQAQSAVDLAHVACALERYRLAHGQYPDSLDALTPQFIALVPHDLINGQPLHYRREADGQFVLYSVGWNEKDDGGVVALREKSGTVNTDQGDWVWRHPAR